MSKNNFVVFTTTDKAKRDEMFHDFRANGDENERQAVRFSGVEVVPDVVGVLTPTGVRKQYRSTWSVAYPQPEKPPVIRRSASGPFLENLKEETND